MAIPLCILFVLDDQGAYLVMFFSTEVELIAMWSLLESRLSSCVESDFPVPMEIHLQKRQQPARRAKRPAGSESIEDWLDEPTRRSTGRLTRSKSKASSSQYFSNQLEYARARSPPDEAEYQTTFIAYPRFDKALGCIRLTKGDVCRLESEMFLNDSVIDFYFW